MWVLTLFSARGAAGATSRANGARACSPFYSPFFHPHAGSFAMVLPSERLQRAQRMLAFDAAGPQHASVDGPRSTRATRGQAAPRYDPSAVDVPLHPRTVDGPEGEEEEEDAAALGEDDELFGRHSEGPEHRADSGAPLDPDDTP